jgi:DNA-binding transcriptional MerR regulator
MNLELLEEIHILKDKGMTEAEIAAALGMQKNILMISLRMEKIISNKFENMIVDSSSLVSDMKKLENKMKKLENKNKELISEIETYKSLDAVELLSDISDLKKSVNHWRTMYNNLMMKYDLIPDFIRRFFEQ